MRFVLIFFFALPLFQCRVIAGIDTDIPQTNQIILPSGFLSLEHWKPSTEQTKNALIAIQKFLEIQTVRNDWKAGEIKKILAHTKQYRVQFIGVKRNGKKLILCNFFPAIGEFEYWKREKVEVMDGGYSFWQIEYDSDSGDCLNFSSNGYA
jgi:hypothetical protein